MASFQDNQYAGTRLSQLLILLVWCTTARTLRRVITNHQQTSTQLFTCQMPFTPPKQQCRSTEGVDGRLDGWIDRYLFISNATKQRLKWYNVQQY